MYFFFKLNMQTQWQSTVDPDQTAHLFAQTAHYSCLHHLRRLSVWIFRLIKVNNFKYYNGRETTTTGSQQSLWLLIMKQMMTIIKGLYCKDKSEQRVQSQLEQSQTVQDIRQTAKKYYHWQLRELEKWKRARFFIFIFFSAKMLVSMSNSENMHFSCRGGSRIFGLGVQICKGALIWPFYPHFPWIPHECKIIRFPWGLGFDWTPSPQDLPLFCELVNIGFKMQNKLTIIIWPMSWENPVLAICEQQRRRSACTSAQSDQRLCYSLHR